MKKISLYLVPLFWTSFASFAQKENCDKSLQKIAIYATTIQIPKPDNADDEYADKYAKLSIPSAAAANYIFTKGNVEGNDRCLIFINNTFQGSAISAPDLKKLMEDVPFKVTSTVSGTGDNSTIEIKLQSTCDEKTIASSKESFSWDDDEEKLKQIGTKVAQELLPMKDKVMEYAKKLRDQDTRYMLDGSRGSIQLKLKDEHMGVGAETEIELQMTDYDGYALKNRKITFNPETVNGLFIPGVEGGVVTPSSVVTDGQGKAKVRFKLTARNATISAHFTGLNPSGCSDVVFGITQIGAVAVYIKLEYMFNDDQSGASLDEMLGVNTSLFMKNSFYKHHDLQALYYPTEALKKNFSLVIPSSAATGKVKYLEDDGFCHTIMNADGALASFAIDANLGAQHAQKEFFGASTSSKRTYLKIDWTAINTGRVQIDFNYIPIASDGLDDRMKGTYFSDDTKDAIVSFVKNPITAKGSPYKWHYIIKFERNLELNGDGKTTGVPLMSKLMISQQESAELHIFSPYE